MAEAQNSLPEGSNLRGTVDAILEYLRARQQAPLPDLEAGAGGATPQISDPLERAATVLGADLSAEEEYDPRVPDVGPSPLWQSEDGASQSPELDPADTLDLGIPVMEAREDPFARAELEQGVFPDVDPLAAEPAAPAAQEPATDGDVTTRRATEAPGEALGELPKGPPGDATSPALTPKARADAYRKKVDVLEGGPWKPEYGLKVSFRPKDQDAPLAQATEKSAPDADDIAALRQQVEAMQRALGAMIERERNLAQLQLPDGLGQEPIGQEPQRPAGQESREICGDVAYADADVVAVGQGPPEESAMLVPEGSDSEDPVGEHAILSETHTDTTPAAVQAGDVIVGVGSPAAWQRLAGVAGKYLRSHPSTGAIIFDDVRFVS